MAPALIRTSFDALLKAHVRNGWVDYTGLRTRFTGAENLHGTSRHGRPLETDPQWAARPP